MGGGGLPTGGQGSKVYVLCAEPKEHKRFRPGTRPGGIGFPAGRIGDRGDREIVYVPNVCVPFPARIADPQGTKTPQRKAEPPPNTQRRQDDNPNTGFRGKRHDNKIFESANFSGGNKRDKLKGTNAQDSQFFADFRRFLLIFAFPGNCSISGAQIFAENRRKPQIFAENRRKPQIFAETRLSHLVCPF